MRSVTDLDQPPSPDGKDMLTPASRADWRAWLSQNIDRQEGLWVVYRKKSSLIEGPTYDDLVEEALCFGWIDSVARRVDDERRLQWFSPRRKGGLWSKLNKQRIGQLEADGLMTEHGLRVIDQAVADGSWSQTDEVDALVVPPDLEAALNADLGAKAAFDALPNSAKKGYLWRVYSAKREKTRSARIESVVSELSAGP